MVLVLGGSFAWGTPFVVDINENTSVLTVQVCVLGNCGSDASRVNGTITIAVNDPFTPTEMTLYDFDLWLLDTIDIDIKYYVGPIQVGRLIITGTNLRLFYAQPGVPLGPIPIEGSAFALYSVPTNMQGTVVYHATGTVCVALGGAGMPCDDTYNLAEQGTQYGDINGSLSVANGVATMVFNPQITVPLLPDYPDLGTLSAWGNVSGTGAVPMQGDGDFDGDGDVDLRDFAGFQNCFTGHAPGTTGPTCRPGDLDGDRDVDATDYVTFETLLAPV